MKILEVETAPEMDKMSKDVSVEDLFSIVSNGQRGRMEEQRCSFDPRTPQQVPVYSPDPDEIYQLVVNSQRRRLDDQRVMLTSVPGIEASTNKEQKETNALKSSFDQIRNMVSGAQSFRRRTPRKPPLTPGSPGSMSRPNSLSNPTQLCDDSATFSPTSDKDRMDLESFQGEQDQLFSLVSQAQRGSIEKQRCSVNTQSHSSGPADQDADQFFTLIANTQNRRLDDQRATLNLLPGIPQSTGVTGQESDQFFKTISRIQSSRIDDQRCSAPKIQLGSPDPPRKCHSRPVSVPSFESGSASFNPISENQERNHFDQDQFFSFIHHVQQTRMDEQRCSFEPNKYKSSIPKSPNASLIGFQTSSAGNHREGNKTHTPQITLTPASPAVPPKAHSRPTSPTLMFCDSPVRPPPTSLSPGSDEQRLLYDDMPMQITFQISMRFPPHNAYNHPCQLPEVFLTIGQLGETVVLPLNPKPGRPVAFNVNPPHSRSASPHRSPARQEQGRSSPNRINVTGPSPHEDYFSLIQRVHTAQLQQNNGQEKGDMNRETRRGKGKNGGRKEKKEGNKEKKK